MHAQRSTAKHMDNLKIAKRLVTAILTIYLVQSIYEVANISPQTTLDMFSTSTSIHIFLFFVFSKKNNKRTAREIYIYLEMVFLVHT